MLWKGCDDMDTWESLERDVALCGACPLCSTRKTAVVGAGSRSAKIMLVGEAPGESEDESGEPFVGRSGKLLCQMLESIGLSRERDIYIANILKCRPPQNRTPSTAEASACDSLLRRQIALLAPRIILCLGRVSAQSLIDKSFKVTQQHGQWVQRDGVWLMGTFHPAALLRSPSQKPAAEEDFRILRAKIEEFK